MVEDLSYVFRLPMSYVPSYMGNVTSLYQANQE